MIIIMTTTRTDTITGKTYRYLTL